MEEKDTLAEQVKEETKETLAHQNDAAEAVKYKNQLRDELADGEVGVEHPHEERQEEDEDRVPKLTFGKILRYLGTGIIILVFVLIFYRINVQNEDYSDYLVWTDEALSVYESTGKLTVRTQQMGSFSLTLERDENNIPTKTYTYTYKPYSDSPYESENSTLKPTQLTYKGCFMVGDPMYIEETKQFMVTFRVNRIAGDRVKEHYSLASAPKGDVYRFALSDGENVYTAYQYVTVEKNSYFYYRLVFDNVDYNYLTDHTDLTESEIKELTLSIFYAGKFNPESPLEVMTVANNVLPADSFAIKKALPAEVDPALKNSPVWETE